MADEYHAPEAGARAPEVPDRPSKVQGDAAQPASPPTPGSKAEQQSSANPLRRWTLTVLAICALLFVYHLIAERLTPYTSQAYVQAFVVEIATEVPGTVVEVNVTDNVLVKTGQPLFRIDPTRFQIAVAQAEAKLAQAGQTIGASTSEIASAEARSSAAIAKLDNVRKQSARIMELVSKGVYSAARGDQVQAELQTAQADVARARADVDTATRQLGPRGADNPQIRTAAADLARARLDLARSTVTAPADGLIVNLSLSAGQYAAAGAPVLTFIDIGSVWVIAEMKEKSLAHVDADDRAELVLDSSPGSIFPARVQSVGWGVSAGAGRGSDGLPATREGNDWLRAPQRFPVTLTIESKVPVGAMRYGSSGRVVVYTDDRPIMNGLGWLLIRTMSWLGYVL